MERMSEYLSGSRTLSFHSSTACRADLDFPNQHGSVCLLQSHVAWSMADEAAFKNDRPLEMTELVGQESGPDVPAGAGRE